MPTPSKPIVPGHDLPVTEYAKDQPQYKTLPAFRQDDGVVLTRWHLSWGERLMALFRGDVYLYQWTFNQPLQPVALQIERPKVDSGGDS